MKSFLLIVIALLFSPFQLKAQDSLQVDTLVAYYPFSGNAEDSSGFANHGEVFGATLTKDRFGNPNSAYEFDGIDDYIRIADADQLTPSTHRISISVWFKTEFPGDRFILYKGSSTTNREYAMGVRIDSVGSFQINQGGSLSDNDHVRTETILEKNVWNHLVGVWDSSSIRIYLNNKLEDEHSTDKRIDNFGSDLFIGTYGGAISQYAFNGVIDDLQIYNTTLDSTLIDSLYNFGGWPETEYHEPVLPDTLVAYYPFSGSAEDSSGFENNGQVFGATLTKDRFGNPNSAYEFDGDGDYINTNSTFDFSNRTTSFWFRAGAETLENHPRQILINQDSYELDFGAISISLTGSVMQFSDGFGESRLLLDGFKSKTWYHVTTVREDSVAKYYLNGKLVGLKPAGFEGSTVQPNKTLLFGSGRSKDQDFFKGTIDDIHLYNYSLSDSSVWNLYTEGGWPETRDTTQNENALVAHYPFSGNANDSSGFGNDGDVFGATLTKDRFGNPNSAYEFDGIDDFINGGSSESLRIDGDLTLSFWFNTPSFLGYSSGIITFQGSNTSSFEQNALYKINFPNNNILNYNHEDEKAEGNVHVFEDIDLQENSWYHVLLKRDTTNRELKLFINGEFADSAKFESNPYGGELSSLRIGENHGTIIPDRFFNGILDDIRIFNYSIPDSGVWDLYTEGGWPETKDTTIVPNDTLAAYYPFSGNANDSSGFGNHADIYGAELTVDRFGKHGYAYEFDGINDFIEIQSPVSFHTNKNLSFSFWAQGVSPDTTFRGFITKRNMNPFGIAIDDGDRLLFTVNNDEIPLNLIVEDLFTDPNVWYQYAAVFKAGEYLRLFRDGIEVGTLYGTIPSNMNVDSGSINFGVTVIENSSSADSLFFLGSMDEIRFYNYDLTPDQVLSLYDLESTTLVSNEDQITLPIEYSLYQNYPNPFNPSTTIQFDLPELSKVSLKVYDITGRLVANLVDGTSPAGTYQVNFDASQLASGIYLYELRTKNFSSIKKFTLIK